MPVLPERSTSKFNNASHGNTELLGRIGRTRMELLDAGRWAAYFTTYLQW